MKNVADFWQYFVNIICNMLFVIWQNFVMFGRIHRAVCYPAMAYVPH